MISRRGVICKTSAPMGTQKCNFRHYWDSMRDRPTDRPNGQQGSQGSYASNIVYMYIFLIVNQYSNEKTFKHLSQLSFVVDRLVELSWTQLIISLDTSLVMFRRVSVYLIKCSDKSMEVKLLLLFYEIMTDRPTNAPINRPTDAQTGSQERFL